MTSHDTAGGNAMPHTTYPTTKISHAASAAVPAPENILPLPLFLVFLGPLRRGIIPSVWNALDAAVPARSCRRSLGGVVGSGGGFLTDFWWILASFFVGFDQPQQLVKHLRIFHIDK